MGAAQDCNVEEVIECFGAGRGSLMCEMNLKC